MNARARLVRLLRAAHAGERAAALAYAGHWRSVRDPGERAAIRRIEADEWEHRRCLGKMLADLGAKPAPLLEMMLVMIGYGIAISCFLGGRFIPMYGAGRIERNNVHEYIDAAVLAREAGLEHLVDELLSMAELEWDHERYFRTRITDHRGLRWLRPWPELPSRPRLAVAPAPRQNPVK